MLLAGKGARRAKASLHNFAESKVSVPCAVEAFLWRGHMERPRARRSRFSGQ